MGGNCSNEHHHQSRLFRAENFTNDPSAFRVFVKKRNKFIPGWLKINDDEIVFSRGGNNFQFWPLAHLRRYGYTCSGVFFFESGRRCATGEGLHTFQSHQAERIFHMVQSKIKIEEYARCGSRAASVVSNGTHRVHSLVPNPGGSARIHPIQRFSSEGAANNEFPPSSADSVVPPPSAPPPPYSAYAVTAATDARRMRQNVSPHSNCPSVVSALSSSMIPQHFVRPPGGGPMADPPALSRDRPRSVVSNIEHGVVLHHRLPHATNTAGQPSPLHHAQAVAATPPPPSSSAVASALFHHHRSPQNVTSSNSASSLMTMAAMMHHQQQRQQQQQNSGFALPPSALNALAASASGSCLMNQSFHSVLDSTGGVSPWASQQQLEGEIVLEHVLGVDSRRRLTPSKGSGGHSPNAAVAEPIRVAVPPPRPQQPQQMQQFTHPSSSSSVLLSSLSSVSAAPTTTPRHCHSGGGESTAAYVNVDFSAGGARHATDRDNGISPEEFAKQQLNVRELHRTDHSRLEFLSTGPGAFMLSSSYGPMSMSTSMVASAHPSEALATALPPALLQHHHQQQKNAHLQQQHCMHHSFYAPPRGLPSGAFHGQQMSASVCGTLPTDDQPAAPPQHWHPQQQSNNESGDGIGIRRFDAPQQHHPIGQVNAFTPSKMPSSPQVGAVQQQTTNPSLSNTTTASSTPS